MSPSLPTLGQVPWKTTLDSWLTYGHYTDGSTRGPGPYPYTYSNVTSTPNSGEIRFDNVNASAATTMYIHGTTLNGVYVYYELASRCMVGSLVTMRQPVGASGGKACDTFRVNSVTAGGVNQYLQLGVTLVAFGPEGDEPFANTAVTFEVIPGTQVPRPVTANLFLKGVSSTPTWSPLAPLVTSLSGSTDGMEQILVDSLTAPTYEWRFRYNASATSTYKWEFVGGADLFIGIPTDETCFGDGGTYDLATPGPVWVPPRAGIYQVSANCACYSTTSANGVMFIGNAGSVITESATNIFSRVVTTNFTTPTAMSVAQAVMTWTSGDIRMKYQGSAGTMHFRSRWMRISPVRV
jgi:hypothetical protein